MIQKEYAARLLVVRTLTFESVMMAIYAVNYSFNDAQHSGRITSLLPKMVLVAEDSSHVITFQKSKQLSEWPVNVCI